MSFAILHMVDPEMTPYEFAKRAASAFFLWPKALLEEELNHPLLANLVQHYFFIGHQSGWVSGCTHRLSALRQREPIGDACAYRSKRAVWRWPSWRDSNAQQHRCCDHAYPGSDLPAFKSTMLSMGSNESP